MNDLFVPPGPGWQQLSPRFATLRRLVLALWCVVLAVLVVLPLLLFQWPAALTWIGLVLVLALFGWGLWWVPRNFRAWGYSERDDDLLVTHGVLVRRLAVVPYGRMQFVDVSSGPVERRFGLASVQLHTASPASDARIPGLPAAEAARLRDRLSALGEAQAAGL